MKKLYFLLFVIISLSNLYASKEYNNWYFGYRCGITFNTPNGEPAPVPESAIEQSEGCSSISDSTGSLLFYTDGISVWNRKHEVMLNGRYLKGHVSSTQSALIVKKPGSMNLYYIFTSDQGGYSNPNNGIYYSIVDMKMDKGYGDVIQQNIFLYKTSEEKLASVPHKNKRDFWIITHRYNNNEFYVYLLTDSGLVSTPVVSSADPYTSPDYQCSIGYMKASYDNKRIAVAKSFCNVIEIFDFNNSTGKLSNPVCINQDAQTLHNQTRVYGIEFSPNNRLLYYSDQNRIYQLDLTLKIDSLIYKNRFLVREDSSCYNFGALQLAPNGRIYITYEKTSCKIKHTIYLSAIAKPNKSGPLCNFVEHAVDCAIGKNPALNEAYITLGLPNCIVGLYSSEIVKLIGDTVCAGDTIRLFSILGNSGSYVSYLWTGPNKFTSTEANPVIPDASLSMTGWYKLRVTTEAFSITDSDSVFVKVNPLPESDIIPKGPITICKGDYVNLKPRQIEQDVNYSWSTGATTPEISVNKEGTYVLTATNKKTGCFKIDSVDVKFYPQSKAKIQAATNVICPGDSLILRVINLAPKDKILWSTGDTTNSITVKAKGRYKIKITNSYGCSSTDSIDIDAISNIDAKIISKKGICKGGEITLTAEPSGKGYTYRWSTGETDRTIKVSKPGTYSVTVTLNNKCKETVSIDLKEFPLPEVNITGNNIKCRNEPIILSADKNFSYYLWSTGDTTKEITINNGGIYSLTITDSNGCSATASRVISEYPEILINFTGNSYFCYGKDTRIGIDRQFKKILWSTGETTREITVYKDGYYKVTVTDTNGCTKEASIYIKENPIPSVNILGGSLLCMGKSAELRTDKEYKGYLWSTGETSQNIEITKTGTYSVTVEDSLGCPGTASIEIKERAFNLFDVNDIDFGKICSGEELEQEITLNNEENETILIKSIYFKNNISGFSINNPPAKLNPKETVKFRIKFAPLSPAYYTDTLIIEITEPCLALCKVEIKGTAIAKVYAWLPDTVGNVGESMFYPIYARLTCGSISDYVSSTAEVSYDASALLPENPQLPFIIDNQLQGRDRVLSLMADSIKLNTTTIFGKIKGTVLLADQDITPVYLKYLRFDNSLIEVAKDDGSIAIKGICQPSFSRIKFFVEIAISVTPTPARESAIIKLTGSETGNYICNIYNVQGEKVKTLSINKQDKEAIFMLDTKDLVDGIYEVVVATQSKVLHSAMFIGK